MVYILYALFFISCLVLIAAVLLQPGKTDAGALFTSNVSSSALAPRGTATVLSKITIVAASTFMLSALLLAMPALTGNVSVLSSNPEAPADAPAVNTDANTAVDSNSNPAVNTNTSADNNNSALIETPATEEAEKKAANARAANPAPANASVTATNSNVAANSAGNANR